MICNMCGQDAKEFNHYHTIHYDNFDEDIKENPHHHYGLTAAVTSGYDSLAFDDLCLFNFHLCEFCLDHIFQMFTVPPMVREYRLVQSDQTIDYVPFANKSNVTSFQNRMYFSWLTRMNLLKKTDE